MKYLSDIELKNLSFPDSDILEIQLDIENKIIEFRADSCYVNFNGGVRHFNCIVTLKNWSSFKVEMYNAIRKETIIVNPITADKLADICEFIIGDEFIFKGFGKSTGQWFEYIFSGGTLNVAYIS